MRKLFFSIIVLLITAATVNAQAPHIEKSEAFDEPDNGYNKVLMMKNGNTLFFHFARKEGIEVNVFNKARKLTSTKEIDSELWDTRKMKNITVAGLYEINNEAVLFIVVSEDREPTLYRMRFNSTTGGRLGENELGSTGGKTRRFAALKEYNSIYVEKDPETDNYAVIFFNGYASDPDEKIKVIHFDGTHKRLNVATYDAPDDNFKYLRFIGAVVDGANRLFIATYGSSSWTGRDGKVFVSSLKAGEKKWVNKSLAFSEDFKDTKSVMSYNHNDNSLQLLTLSYTTGEVAFFTGRGRTKYMSFLSSIDPETLELKSVKPLGGQKINEYAHTVLNTDLDYHGLPQQMIINKDNSTTILCEEIRLRAVTTRTQHSTYTRYYTDLGGIGVSEINSDGTEKSGYWIRKQQEADGLYEPLYISSRGKGRWSYLQGFADHNSYLSYDYIYTDKNRYIIFNDDNANFDRDEDEKKRKTVRKVGKLNTFCYSLNGTGVNKSFLFGDPGDNDVSNSVHIDASDIDKATGTYCTIMVERDGKDRQAKMVWIKFE